MLVQKVLGCRDNVHICNTITIFLYFSGTIQNSLPTAEWLRVSLLFYLKKLEKKLKIAFQEQERDRPLKMTKNELKIIFKKDNIQKSLKFWAQFWDSFDQPLSKLRASSPPSEKCDLYQNLIMKTREGSSQSMCTH